MKIIRRRYIISGRVQGVGFRYRAFYAASEFNVNGWVKNCDDGDVEMEVEGKEEDIDKMLLAIEKGRFVRIENIRSKEIPVMNEHSFEIKGY